jgi:thiosulfate/3-mercaptopyruvate sulfurtransferase
MANNPSEWLVETSWLAERLDAPDIVVLDGSMHLPTAKRDAQAEYLAEHIPGALFFSIDEIADETSALPHMLPSPTKFASRMKKMGKASTRQRACGGCSAPWATTTWRC